MKSEEMQKRLADLDGFLKVCPEYIFSAEEDYKYGQMSRNDVWIITWFLNRAMHSADEEAERIRFRLEMISRDPSFEEKMDSWFQNNTKDSQKNIDDITKLEGLRRHPHDICYLLLDEQYYEKYGNEDR